MTQKDIEDSVDAMTSIEAKQPLKYSFADLNMEVSLESIEEMKEHLNSSGKKSLSKLPEVEKPEDSDE